MQWAAKFGERVDGFCPMQFSSYWKSGESTSYIVLVQGRMKCTDCESTCRWSAMGEPDPEKTSSRLCDNIFSWWERMEAHHERTKPRPVWRPLASARSVHKFWFVIWWLDLVLTALQHIFCFRCAIPCQKLWQLCADDQIIEGSLPIRAQKVGQRYSSYSWTCWQFLGAFKMESNDSMGSNHVKAIVPNSWFICVCVCVFYP